MKKKSAVSRDMNSCTYESLGCNNIDKIATFF